MRTSARLASIPAILLTVTALAGCSGGGTATPSSSSGSPAASSPAVSGPAASAAPVVHWTYAGEEGPDHWGELSQDFSLCESGTRQSPVDLSSEGVQQGDELELQYASIAENVTNTGHTFQMNSEDRAEVQYDGTEYELVQMHYHDPSEHTVDGEHAPIEFHFVNKDAAGNLLVVGILGVESPTDTPNPGFEPFVEEAEQASDAAVEGDIDLGAMMPPSTDHFAYSGSLTTPPCSEGVQWIVMETPVELGHEQILTLQGLYEGNNRPTQALNGRDVFVAETAIEG
jgi:carbonic anhydrase